jgi:hypothetical protein
MLDTVSASALADLARAALLEITSTDDIGALVSESTDGEGVTTVLFASAMLGYPDWYWTVSIATLPGEEATVLEAELLPGDGSLLAPEWVPWADRLEDYKAAQAAIAAGELAAGDADEDDDDSDDDEHDDDEHGDDVGDDPDDGIDFESDESLAQLEAEALDDDDDDDDDDDIDDDDDDDIDDDELADVPASVGVDEQHETQAESDEGSPEPPAAPVRKQRAKKQQ